MTKVRQTESAVIVDSLIFLRSKPLKSGGEEKMECIGNAVLSRAVSFQEYSTINRR